jgi:hypothetical protein
MGKGPSAGNNNTNKDGKGKESKDIGSSSSSHDVCLRVIAKEMKHRCDERACLQLTMHVRTHLLSCNAWLTYKS